MGLMLALVFVIVVSIALPFCRAWRFGLAMWGPVVALDLLILNELLAPLMRSQGGGGPDGGFSGMGAGFYLLFAAPACVVAVVSLGVAIFCFPVQAAWNRWGVALGAVTTTVLCYAFLGQTSPQMTVVVIDSAGRPVSGETVTFLTSEFGSSRTLATRQANAEGKVQMRVPAKEWRAVVERGGITSVLGVENRPIKFQASNICVETLSWNDRKPNGVRARFAKIRPFGSNQRFELRLREEDEIASKWMADVLHRTLLEAMGDIRYAEVLHDTCGNLESFGEFELLGRLAQENDAFALTVGSILEEKADVIDGIQRMIREEERREGKEDQAHRFDAICRWLKVDATGKSKREMAISIRERLQAYADELLKTAEPLWKTHGPVGFHVRTYARAAAPRLLHAMEGKDEGHAMAYWSAVASSEPEVAELEVFFVSSDRYVAAAAISAVLRKLSQSQAATALERLNALSHHGENTWFQHQLDDLIPKVRLVAIGGRPPE